VFFSLLIKAVPAYVSLYIGTPKTLSLDRFFILT
jgi:hypothetical protein